MLKPAKSRFLTYISGLYADNLLKRRFDTLKISGFNELADKNSQVPTIIYCNHTSWWDGPIIFSLSRLIPLDSFFLMEEKNLRSYPLFRRLGAFSIVREAARPALESLDFAADLLRASAERAVWIFPQGEIRPADRRPLGFYNGIGSLARRIPRCRFIPLAIRFDFTREYKPSITIRVGSAHGAGAGTVRKVFAADCERRMTQLLDELGRAVAEDRLAGYDAIF